MSHPQQPPQQPQSDDGPSVSVTPQPTPFQPLIGRATLSDGREVVLLQLFLVTGQIALFMPHEGAAQLGQDLIAHSKMAASGLVLPPGIRLGDTGPSVNGHPTGPAT